MAAARLLPLLRRRLTAVITDFRGFSFPPPATAGLRALQTITEVGTTASDENSQGQEDSDINTAPSSVPTAESSFKVTEASNLKISPRHDLAMVFTCKVCETRSMKTASRESYEKGVVVARCGGCNNLHLIADRLGWFGEPGSIEDFLAAQGEEVKKGSTDTLNFTLEDLVGSQVSSKEPSDQS
ncbi:hypothetical protein QOZ80_2AG0150680 [Eleusine coracana subsp. coracana]|nr:hypothetical protein QOZ80_2AG0150680 [Eleusine coracana subsp. coracana]